VSADPLLEPVADRADKDVDRLEALEDSFEQSQVLVAADRILSTDFRTQLGARSGALASDRTSAKEPCALESPDDHRGAVASEMLFSVTQDTRARQVKTASWTPCVDSACVRLLRVVVS
jgi:hypothetical protein